MSKRLSDIRELQLEFQKAAGFPVDTISATERNEVSEKYLFKLIEEVIELRKEFPSVMNPWSKSQKREDVVRVKEELSDIILFLFNFMNVWRFTDDEILETLEKVQNANFDHIKKKRMHVLNCEIQKVPEKIISPGTGHLTPKYVFIGMNPGQALKPGNVAWGKPYGGSAKVLRGLLETMGLDDDSYFTNLVKVPTEGNTEPSEAQTEFWLEFLNQELEILGYNNPDMKIISLGRWVSSTLEKNKVCSFIHLSHPATVLRGKSLEEYKDELTTVTLTPNFKL